MRVYQTVRETFEESGSLLISCTDTFFVYLNGVLKGPRTSVDHFFELDVSPGDDLRLDYVEGSEYFFDFEPFNASDPVSDENHVPEVIEDSQLDMFERMRAQIINELSQFAEEKGMETFDEAEDLDFDEDSDTILTPYEYKDMVEEYPSESPHDSGDAPAMSGSGLQDASPSEAEPPAASDTDAEGSQPEA